SEKARNTLYVSRVPGGEYFNRNRMGDPNAQAPLVLVDPKQQREAIKMLSQTIFSDKYFTNDPELLNELVPTRDWGLDGLGDVSARVDFPVHEVISNMQAYAMMNLIAPWELQRVYDAELKSKADDKFTAAELINSVRDAVWSELKDASGDAKFTDAKPMISSIRRNLQRQHLAYLLVSAQSRPGYMMSPDLQAMVRLSLQDLGGQISDVLKSDKDSEAGSHIDFGTRAHLLECRDEIDRALNVQHVKRSAE
ncbi:MAG TPA: zinc-dependent metalloprotease, partial [Tepidisphaeraceae bacterium]|nr:zinc-dependent metalloprotease [Tepidisphaeraceae bacterium]